MFEAIIENSKICHSQLRCYMFDNDHLDKFNKDVDESKTFLVGTGIIYILAAVCNILSWFFHIKFQNRQSSGQEIENPK